MGKITSKNQNKSEKKLRLRLKMEISSGGVVFTKKDNSIFVLLIKDPYYRWALPKGKIEEGETQEMAAMREIDEETGIKNLNVIDKLGTVRYFFNFKGQRIFKIVHNFLFETEYQTPKFSSEIKDAKWFDIQSVENKISYDNTKKILEKAINILKESYAKN